MDDIYYSFREDAFYWRKSSNRFILEKAFNSGDTYKYYLIYGDSICISIPPIKAKRIWTTLEHLVAKDVKRKNEDFTSRIHGEF